jgi:UDP-N-acetylglucosamine diphosphorylase / glucose-1-phosphate thymidylyltransferase / UDP-N-acetylgalactosamine diphosphorylase / glucosamine-1-phosphate N-acetyltransferase / galactosamine-1-phosphate N-acetyltransferase
MKATFLPPRNPSLCAPLTSNRELSACLIANVPMKDLISAELTRAGFQLVDPAEACERTLRIPLDNWIELGALLLLGRTPRRACLVDVDGNVLAWKGDELPENCGKKIVTEANCFQINYPWDLLRMNEEVLAMLDESSILGEVSPLASLSGHIRVGAGSRILPGTVIEGPVIIGQNSQIGPNAYIRGATSIGANCFIGNGAEVKNSVIYNNTYVSRQCYVGDSIIGTHVTLGAGTCTENHRHDGRHHVSMIQGHPINTGRLKFGAILGDGVFTGVNTSIDAGIKIGIARTTKPGSYISKDLL